MPPLLADFIHHRVCKPICEKLLTLPWKCIPGSPSINKRVFAPPKRNTDTKYYTGSVEEMAKAIVDTLEAERLI